MTDQSLKEYQTLVKELNATPLSRHLERLLGMGGGQYLTINSMVYWVTENLPDRLNRSPEAIDEAIAVWGMDDPQALYDRLEEPDLEKAETLEQAGEIMLEILNGTYQPQWISDANLAR
jgi:hypothetical protein